jgi:hypothetical protein
MSNRLFHALIELAAITLIGLLYLAFSVPARPNVQARELDLTALIDTWTNSDMRPTGIEQERLEGVLLPIRLGLQRYGRVSTWNPYIGGGEPIINNPFSYLFNPFHSLPVLLLGGVQGGKLATVIALLLAGYNAWALAWAAGAGGVGRVTAGALYLLSGGIAAKYNAGHFQLAMSLSWPPLVLAGMLRTLRGRGRLAPVTTGVAFALLFFAGNIYYTLHTLVCCSVLVAVYTIYRFDGRWHLRRDRLKRAALAGGFAFGLSALQFVPVWTVRDFIKHDAQVVDAGALSGSYPLQQAFANLTTPWLDWHLLESEGLLAPVDYAYIGAGVFALILAGAPFLWRDRIRRGIALIAFALALLMMVWASGQNPLLEWLYAHIALLAQFRYLGRALAVAALWWALLVGLSTDALWRAARNLLHADGLISRGRITRALLAAVFVWGYFAIYSLSNTSTRQRMVFYNYSLLNRLDAARFTTVEGAVTALFVLLLAALLLDTALLVLEQVIRGLYRRRQHALLLTNTITAPVAGFAGRHFQGQKVKLAGAGEGFKPFPTRENAEDYPRHRDVNAEGEGLGMRVILASLLRTGVLGAALLVLRSPLETNSPLFSYARPDGTFRPLYPLMRETPFPSAAFPHSPLTFEMEEAGVRDWSLNEGWRPGAPPGIIPPAAGDLADLPRWGVVSPLFGDLPERYSQEFVDTHGYVRRACLPACDGAPTLTLYELPDALPYAFIVRGDDLVMHPDRLNRQNVIPAEIISHEMDRMQLRAALPGNSTVTLQLASPEPYYLVVSETNFPGWKAEVDGQPASIFTAETNHTEQSYSGLIAIPIQPGDHQVMLTYEAPGLPLGITLFLLTCAGIALYFLRTRQHS